MNRTLAVSLGLLAGILSAQEFKLGSQVTDFSIQDLDGQPVASSTLRGPITVVTFIATQCPVSNSYNQRMNAIYQDYSSKGVKLPTTCSRIALMRR